MLRLIYTRYFQVPACIPANSTLLLTPTNQHEQQMKAPGKSIWIMILLAVLVASVTQAQFYNDMSVSLAVGAYVYQGDLTPEQLGSLRTLSPGINAYAKKPLNAFLSARFNIHIANLQGDDSKYSSPAYRKQRNFAFSTPLKEFSLQLAWDIRGLNYNDHGLRPYIFSGAGISFLNIRKDYSRMNTAFFSENPAIFTGLAADNATRLPRRLLSIPVGVGLEYPVSNRISLNLESAYRFIFTDYLDGFSKSADPNRQDHYHSTSVGVIYKFGKNDNGVGCPVMKQ